MVLSNVIRITFSPLSTVYQISGYLGSFLRGPEAWEETRGEYVQTEYNKSTAEQTVVPTTATARCRQGMAGIYTKITLFLAGSRVKCQARGAVSATIIDCGRDNKRLSIISPEAMNIKRLFLQNRWFSQQKGWDVDFLHENRPQNASVFV